MKITQRNQAGTMTPGRAPVKTWREHPGAVLPAIRAAVYYAQKHDSEMIVVPGNSYGNSVYHIARPEDDRAKYRPGEPSILVYVVNKFGTVYQAKAE